MGQLESSRADVKHVEVYRLLLLDLPPCGDFDLELVEKRSEVRHACPDTFCLDAPDELADQFVCRVCE